MAIPVTDETESSERARKLKHTVLKITVLVLLGLGFGYAHGWASTRLYGRDRVAGFHTGVIQGALMPSALPSLLMGKDLPIYAPNNEGRAYNIGYIFGINTCGTLFFGVGFWPLRARKKPDGQVAPAQ